MQGAPTNPTSPDRVVVHPLDAGDAAIAAAARAATKAVKGVRLGVEGRGQYDAFMEGVSPAEGLKVEKGAVGGVKAFGLVQRMRGPTRLFSICTAVGSISAALGPTAPSLGTSLSARAQMRSSWTIGLPPNILFRPRRTTCWPVIADLPGGMSVGLP